MRTVLAALALLLALPLRAAVSPLWPEVESGPHSVGFKVFPLRDTSRASLPLTVSVWYPAKNAGGAERMTYEAYGRHDSNEIGRPFFENPFNFPDRAPITDEAWSRLQATPTMAVPDAPALAGSFPLLVAGNGARANALTNEYLASHGYIVASVAPQRFVPSPQVEQLESAARNIEFTIGWMLSFPNVDATRIATMGFSAGGFGAYLAAMRNSDVDAVAAIDSGLFMRQFADGFTQHFHHRATNLRVPFLHMFRAAFSRTDEDLAPFRNLRYSERYRFLLDDERLVHQDYSTYGAASVLLGMRGEAAGASRRGFTAANLQLLRFFDATLKGDARARQSLVRDDAVVTVEHLPAVTPAPTAEETRELIRRLGPAEGVKKLVEARKADPEADIFTDSGLATLGWNLVTNDRSIEAAKLIAGLLEKQAAETVHFHNLAGNILMAEGRNAEAVAAFEKAIAALPRTTEMTDSVRLQSKQNIEAKIRRLRQAAPPRAWGNLAPGPHRAGFRTMNGVSIPGSAGWEPRDIEIAVWYPAQQDGTPMHFGDLFEIAADLRRRSGTVGVAITGDPAGLAPDVEKSILESPLFARRDATAVAGSFPVVLWSARYGTVAAQAVLSEYLASHGHVVAAVWPKSAAEKLPFEAKTAEEKLEELDAQSDDLRGALRAVRELAVADDQRAAILAWSYAGESAWRLAQGDARIEVVIGLDTTVDANWVYHPRPSSVPMWFRFAKLDRNTPELAGSAHGNFNALEGMIPAIFGIEKVQPWSKGGVIAKTTYETISRRVQQTLAETFARPVSLAYTPLELTAADGSKVTADLYRADSPRGCVALFHQSGSSRGEFRTLAPELTRLGLTALAVDVRWGNRDRWNDVENATAARHGTPAVMQRGDRDAARTIRAGSMHDFDAAVDWLRSQGCAKPIVWGSSIHANGVFELAARRPDDLAAVIDVSPGEYDRERPDRMKTLVAGIRVPSFVVWGRNERDLSKPIFDALPDGAKASYESTGRHGDPIFFEDPQAWSALRAFLETLR